MHHRGSGNTNNSNATTLDSNQRFSYASTIPSSVDSHDEEGDLPFQPRQKYAPIPRQNTQPVEPEQQSRKPFSLKTAGRALSFGNSRSAKNVEPPVNNALPPVPPVPRDRAMTASSYASTATPPKLDLGGSSGLGLGEGGFGDMFSKRKSTVMEENSPSPPPGQPSLSTQAPARMNPAASSFAPPHTNTSYTSSNSTVEPLEVRPGPFIPSESYPLRDAPPRRTGSPYSWKSGASEERLMSTPNQHLYTDSPAFRPAPPVNGDVDSSVVLDALNASRFLENEHNPQLPRQVPEKNTAARARGPPRGPPTSYRGPEPPRRSPLSTAFPEYSQDRPDGFSDVDLNTHTHETANEDDEPLFDAPRPRRLFGGKARAAAAPQQPGKVMTPAEFEEYKKNKETAPVDEDNKSEVSSEDNYEEDDDEQERLKEAAKHRRKQEAHLAVYRQQMMKVTGEQPSELPSQQPSRVPLERASNSAPVLLGQMTFENKNSPNPSKSSEDEDDEIPLGVLQAHGFPNKNRPPTRLSQSTEALPRPESTATYPTPGNATRNESAAGGGGNLNLPVFAKHLPQDPYVGASLVNAPARESLAFNSHGSHTPPQVAPQGPPPPPGNLPPGGLVGVIATEERAKALRRGSPNARGTYDPTPAMQLPHEIQEQQMMQQMMHQPPMNHYQQPQQMQRPQPNSQQMTGSEQAQVQVANQMTQMMQMQMQWMQMMMQQNGGQMPNNMQMPSALQIPPGMPASNGMQTPQLPQQNFGQPNFLNTDPMARPTSTASAQNIGNHQRGISNASRGPSPQHLSSSQSVYGMQGPGPGYTPSIAPSERSTVGQPSRYRPVTPGANQNRESRTSSVSQNTVQPSALRGKRSQSRLRNEASNGAPKPTIKAVEKPKHAVHDDDDDDAGWAEMQRQRQARKGRWKQSKPQSTVPGSDGSGLEGLLYQGPQN